MADIRYNRWQGLAIGQLSVVVALISGLSVGSLGIGLSLIQKEGFSPHGSFKSMFVWSFIPLFFAVLFSCCTVITRLLDFRLTARQVRKKQNPNYNRPLTIFWLSSNVYGRATWALFWLSCVFFIVGIALLFISVGGTYANSSNNKLGANKSWELMSACGGQSSS